MMTSRLSGLAGRAVGKIRSGDFELVEVPVPEAGDGQFVVEVTCSLGCSPARTPASSCWNSSGSVVRRPSGAG
jgi:hypothetical protein